MPQAPESPELPARAQALTPPVFAGFHDVYVAVLRDLVTNPHHHINTRGNRGPEQLNVSFQIANPAARVPLLSARKVNIVFNLAEALWFLGGRDDLAMMRYYSPQMASYSVDGLTIPGAAYGTRLFRTGARQGERSAFNTILELIRSDPDTNRAVLPIFRANEVGDGQHPDVSCTIAFQLLQRDGVLHGVCYMRAKDAFRGLTSDVFSFSFIQELAARLLGLQLGTYTQHVGSMHIADAHLPQVHAIVDEAATEAAPTLAWPRMPLETTSEVVDEVRVHEQHLRANLIAHTTSSLERSGLPRYWQNLIALLEVYRQITYAPGRSVDPEIAEFLEPAHRWLVHHRWPGHVPVPNCDN